MTYLIETDVLIDYLRNIEGAANYLDSIGEWTYSVVTTMELITGAANQKDVKKLEKILNDYRETPLSQEIGARARELMKIHAKPDGLLPPSGCSDPERFDTQPFAALGRASTHEHRKMCPPPRSNNYQRRPNRD